MNNLKDRIIAAFASTDPSYLASCIAQRQPGNGGAGSRFLKATTADEVRDADWESLDDPAITSPAVGFKAPLRGRFGLIRTQDLAPDAQLTLNDQKGTGKVSPTVAGVMGPEVEYTILILGPDRESGKEVVWTFFPGPAVAASEIPATGDTTPGTVIRPAQAKALGFDWVKII